MTKITIYFMNSFIYATECVNVCNVAKLRNKVTLAKSCYVFASYWSNLIIARFASKPIFL